MEYDQGGEVSISQAFSLRHKTLVHTRLEGHDLLGSSSVSDPRSLSLSSSVGSFSPSVSSSVVLYLVRSLILGQIITQPRRAGVPWLMESPWRLKSSSVFFSQEISRFFILSLHARRMTGAQCQAESSYWLPFSASGRVVGRSY